MKKIRLYKNIVSNNLLRIYLYLFRIVFPKFRKDIMFFPRSISLEITNNCNLRCVMCCRASLNKINIRNLSTENFNYILGQIPTLKEVNFIGLGEPLIHPKFFDLLKIAKDKNIRITFTTNGTLLTKENIKKMTDNVSAIHFSIDDVDPENYKKIRGIEIEKVINNLKNLRKLRKDIIVTIQVVMMKRNIKNIHKILYLAKGVKANISFIHMISFDKKQNKQHIINIGRKEFELYMKRIRKLSKKLGVRIMTRSFFPKQRFCVEPFSSPYITIEGEIHPCNFVFGSPKRIYKTWYNDLDIDVPRYKFIVRNIFKDSFSDIWNGKQFRAVRNIIKEAQSKYPKSLTPEQFNKLRKSIDTKKGFNYCKICPYRWSCSC